MILIPTRFEQEILTPLLKDAGLANIPVELCGFGPIAAAARTSQIVAQCRPAALTLIGIAGSYSDTYPIGSAAVFQSVACYGIGVGTGSEFRTAAQLGWPQWAESDPQLADRIPLSPSLAADHSQLLTVCAAAASANDVAMRRAAFPDAVAEDMEGFGVAMACALADVPLCIVRGISNVASDRDKSHWKISDALRAAADLTGQLLSRE
jgi:futalosine hydrolase